MFSSGKHAFVSTDREFHGFRLPTNPVNPALAMFRQMHGRRQGADLAMAAGAWASSLMQMSLAGSFTIREAKHARLVLSRVARITEAVSS